MGRYESPEYRVKEKEGAFELREYQEFHVVKYKENEDPMNSGGFQTLFRYISKNNEKEAKISMTVPVIEKKEEEVYTRPLKKWLKISQTRTKEREECKLC